MRGHWHTRNRHRIRQLGAGLVLVIAGAATLADTPAIVQSEYESAQTTVTLDADRALETTLFSVTLPAEAASGHQAHWTGAVIVDAATAFDRTGASMEASAGIYLRVAAVAPTGVSPQPQYREEGQSAVQARPGASAQLSLSCQEPGPCSRGFRLVAALGPGAAKATVTWHVESSVYFDPGPYPSGVHADVRILEPVARIGAAPQMDASTPPATVVLGAGHPAALREVEVRVQPGTGPAAGNLELDLKPGLNGGVNAHTYMYDITDPAKADGRSYGLGGNENVFLKCSGAEVCIRRFLVTFVWKGGPDTTYTWRLIVHRTDLAQVTAETENRLAIETTAAADPGEPRSTLHLEGDMVYAPGGINRISLPLTIQANPDAIVTAAAGQIDASTVATWPIAGTIHAAAKFTSDPGPDAWLDVNDASLPGGYASATVDGNPLWGCMVGATCPLDLYVSAGYGYQSKRTPAPFNIHWTVDLTLYSYPGVVYDMVREPVPAAS